MTSSLNVVLEKTLKGIRGVRLDNRQVLCVLGPRTKFFEHLFFCHLKNYNKVYASIGNIWYVNTEFNKVLNNIIKTVHYYI